MVFPSLEAGNISYKIAQRLGGYRAVGPLIQGLAAPMHDLSCGCSVQEIIELALVAAIAASDRSEPRKAVYKHWLNERSRSGP